MAINSVAAASGRRREGILVASVAEDADTKSDTERRKRSPASAEGPSVVQRDHTDPQN